ncbi:Crp/Fnr family transcriptional regulator [Lactobacillus corticis]|uniref:Transcriptional regulator n=1 Tax=Lactobacillus corticis TaxID=2201249 RepID=A0A916QI48_9LACO|nr:Crp/Fnr family transcriptional regulator [Lactobacillus corticis]GFZ26452.1 transcriptional regulator [Lactobacillus corticis]
MPQLNQLCVTKVPLFKTLALPIQAQIEGLIRHRHFERGEQVLGPEAEGSLLIVEEGKVKLYRLSADGSEHFQKLLGTGDYAGEAGLFAAGANDFFAEAESDADVCLITYHDFIGLLEQHPAVTMALLQATFKQNQQLSLQAKLLTISSIEERVLEYLNSRAQPSGRLNLTVKFKDLASYLGTTPETLSRSLKNLEQSGKIKRQQRQIQLLSEI